MQTYLIVNIRGNVNDEDSTHTQTHAGLRARECMHIARVLCIIMIVLLHRVKIKRHHFNCTGDEVNDHCNIITFLFSTHAYEKHFRSFVYVLMQNERFLQTMLTKYFFQNI